MPTMAGAFAYDLFKNYKLLDTSDAARSAYRTVYAELAKTDGINLMLATYFRVTNAMMVQKISDKTPRLLSGSTGIGWCPAQVSLRA